MVMEFALEGEAKNIVPVAIEELAYAHRWDASGNMLLVYLDETDAPELREQVARLAAAGYGVSEVSAANVEPEDWVAQSQASFAPIHAGHFFVHADNFDGTPPENAHVIEMNAGAAFGTGEHATTSGCLEAIAGLEAKVNSRHCEERSDEAISCDQNREIATSGMRPPRNDGIHCLDMGCGTAILAIAMVRQWGAGVNVVAVDVDAPAVAVSKENCEKNEVAAQVQCGQSDGYAAQMVRDGAPYDVIAANILANPLMAMASDCAASLSEGGYAVLSGFTQPQVADVIAAHEAVGLVHVSTDIKDGWATSVMRKL